MATAAVTNDFVASATIVSDDVDTNFSDLVTFLNGSVLHTDGAKAMSGDLDMGQNDINNVPWKTWTPTYDNIVQGNGTVVARYIQIGDLVIAQFLLTFGSSTTLVADHTISLPVSADTSFGGDVSIGLARLRDVGGTTRHGFVLNKTDADKCEIRVWGATGTYLEEALVTATIPFPWNATDKLSFNIQYEAA